MLEQLAPHAHLGHGRYVATDLDTDPLDRVGRRELWWRGADVAARRPPDRGTPPDSTVGRAARTEALLFFRQLDPGQQYQLTGSHGQVAAPVLTPEGRLIAWGVPQPSTVRREPDPWDTGLVRGDDETVGKGRDVLVETPIRRDRHGRIIVAAGRI